MSNFHQYIFRNPRGRRAVKVLVLERVGPVTYRRMVRHLKTGTSFGERYLEATCNLFGIGDAVQAVLKAEYLPEGRTYIH